MKRGDKVPVMIGGHVVAQAEVREIGEGEATLVVPATLVRMGVRTTLDDLPEPAPSNNETVITGVDRTTGESAPVGETPVPPVEHNTDAPVGQPVDSPATTVEPVEAPKEVSDEQPVSDAS